MQPRQIYASTLDRRDRRWGRRHGRGLWALALVAACALVPLALVLTDVTRNLT